MKKLIIILIAAISMNAASAQSRNSSYRNDDHGKVMQKDNRNYNDQRNSKDYAYNNKNQSKNDDRNEWRNGNKNEWNNDGRNEWKSDRDRQEAYDRMNRDYDQRIDGYRKDRLLSPYERDRKIRKAQQEREQSSKSFGTGLIVGGIAALLVGILAGH